MDFRERFNKSYISIIERDYYLSTFVEELKPIHEITQVDIDILLCYIHLVHYNDIKEIKE